MKLGFKIVIGTLAGVGLLFIVLVVVVLIDIYRPHPERNFTKELPLSNGGILRVHALAYNGPHGSPYFYDASYRTARNTVSERVGAWGGGAPDGDVVGCPVDNLVVVNPLLSQDIFVRNSAGRWKSMDIEIPGNMQPAFGIEQAAAQTGLSVEDLRKLQAFFMALDPALGSFHPSRMQFVAGPHELWADFFSRIPNTLESDLYRVRLKLSTDGEHLQLLDTRKIPNKRGPIEPDREPDAVCTRVNPFV